MRYRITLQTYIDKSYFFAELSKYEFVVHHTYNNGKQFNLDFRNNNDVTPLL